LPSAELLRHLRDLRADGRVLVAQQRVDDIARGQFAAVVKTHAAPQIEVPVGAVGALDRLRQRRPGLKTLVLDRRQSAVEHEMPRVVGRGCALGGIERVVRCGKLGRDADRAANGWRAPLRRPASAKRQSAGARQSADEMAA